MRVLAGVLVTVALSGCGGATRRAVPSGKVLFLSECARCHSLVGREKGAPGGDLAIPTLSVKDIASFARVMPTRTRLSRAEARAVATYVHDVARKTRKS